MSTYIVKFEAENVLMTSFCLCIFVSFSLSLTVRNQRERENERERERERERVNNLQKHPLNTTQID